MAGCQVRRTLGKEAIIGGLHRVLRCLVQKLGDEKLRFKLFHERGSVLVQCICMLKELCAQHRQHTLDAAHCWG